MSTRTKYSQKWTRVTEDNDFGEVTTFIKIPYTFSSWIPRTSEEVVAIVSTLYLSFVHNLPEGESVELDPELAHSMLKVDIIFSRVSARRGDVLAPCNPS